MNAEIQEIRKQLEQYREAIVRFDNGYARHAERGILFVEPILNQEGLDSVGDNAYLHLATGETMKIPLESINRIKPCENKILLFIDDYIRKVRLEEEHQNGRT